MQISRVVVEIGSYPITRTNLYNCTPSAYALAICVRTGVLDVWYKFM